MPHLFTKGMQLWAPTRRGLFPLRPTITTKNDGRIRKLGEIYSSIQEHSSRAGVLLLKPVCVFPFPVAGRHFCNLICEVKWKLMEAPL